jgi:hypothetical protein
MTVIWGKSTGFWTPTVAKASWSLLTVLISSGSMMPATPGMPSVSAMAVLERLEGSGRVGVEVKVEMKEVSALRRGEARVRQDQ